MYIQKQTECLQEKPYCGFSLLELLVVIAIIAIVSSVSLHSWQTVQQRLQLSSATQQLLAFLNQVQAEANWRNKTNTLHLFTQTAYSPWCIAVTTEVRPNTCDTPLRFLQPDSSINISGLTALSTLAFYGRRDMAQTGTIRLANQIGQTRVIVSTRGRIRYCSYNLYLNGIPKC